jgi:2-(1,2-epoxy-1,2-dihydrophenyl)acetyl-CoA isomerase
MLRAIRDCQVPVIAAVNGVAAGAGANLALACDVVIAAEEASFVQAFTRIGLVPDAGGTWTLPRQVGMARAMGAMLFADKVSARQAADWGMIWEAVPGADFVAHWRARAGALAAGPTVAYRGVKSALNASADATLDEQLALEARLQAECGRTADFREGVAAFTEKRAPRFTGR